MEPHVNDVLMGRGASIYNHRGNINFRNIVLEYKSEYVGALNNYGKDLILKEVYRRVKLLSPPGRFLRHDNKNKVWVEMDEKEAKPKISQALREKRSEPKRKQWEDAAEHVQNVAKVSTSMRPEIEISSNDSNDGNQAHASYSKMHENASNESSIDQSKCPGVENALQDENIQEKMTLHTNNGFLTKQPKIEVNDNEKNQLLEHAHTLLTLNNTLN